MAKETHTVGLVRKKVNQILQHNKLELRGTRRFACALEGERIVATSMSGMKGQKKKELDTIKWAEEQHGVLIGPSEFSSFEGMLSNLGFEKEEDREAEACAEARLWMTIHALNRRNYGQSGQSPRHQCKHPRHLKMWVFELTRKLSIKEDSPCRNCRQWVFDAFAAVNGTNRR